MLYFERPKDPDDVLDYEVDWEAWLDGDVIDTSTWAIETGTAEVESSSVTGDVAKVWLSGGTLGEVCFVRNRIVTLAGRTADQVVKLRIKLR